MSEAGTRCPTCGGLLVRVERSGTEISMCRECDGAYVDQVWQTDLIDAIAEHPSVAAARSTDRSSFDPTPAEDDPLDGGAPSIWRSVPIGRVVALVLVALFIGGAVTYAVSQEHPPGSDSIDVGFFQDMTAHHEQAVQLAQIALRNGEDPTVRIFAQEVILAQQWELGRMYQKLRDWGASTDRQETAMEWMGMPVPTSAMPGLATEEQVAGLRAARGAEADALFLDLIAEHHRGGAQMAAAAAQSAGDETVRELAAVMERNQSLEIAEYRQVAERLGYDIEIEPYDPDASERIHGG